MGFLARIHEEESTGATIYVHRLTPTALMDLKGLLESEGLPVKTYITNSGGAYTLQIVASNKETIRYIIWQFSRLFNHSYELGY